MKKLLNTLYITSEDSYLSLDGETIVVLREKEILGRIPLHNLENIVAFGYAGASPALMGECANKGIGLCFMTPHGRFLARVTGEKSGNVYLRKQQYRLSDNEAESTDIAKSFIIGKIMNCKRVIDRALSDHSILIDADALSDAGRKLQYAAKNVHSCTDLSSLRGHEGEAAQVYFGVFDELILHQKESFYFKERSRRPPLDNMNSLLSFLYTLLSNDIASSLETVGLDPYVGFLHRVRPGRTSLALDMMEELRPVLADRLALSLINRKQISGKDFFQHENGSILIKDDARKEILKSWQERKKEELTHPFLNEKIKWGLVVHAQCMLLARYIRGDIDGYPPFFWR